MKSSLFIYQLLLFFVFVTSDAAYAEFDTSVMTNLLHNMAVKQAMKSQQKQNQKNEQSQTVNNNPTEISGARNKQQGAHTKTKILIVTGEEMYSAANNPLQAKVFPKILETVASSLKDELMSSGQSAEIYLRSKNDPKIREFLPRILEHRLHHSLIQVALLRENNGDIYITPKFNLLSFQADSVQISDGIEGKYRISSAANPNAQGPTFGQVAEQFVLDLKKNGYIQN